MRNIKLGKDLGHQEEVGALRSRSQAKQEATASLPGARGTAGNGYLLLHDPCWNPFSAPSRPSTSPFKPRVPASPSLLQTDQLKQGKHLLLPALIIATSPGAFSTSSYHGASPGRHRGSLTDQPVRNPVIAKL